MPSGPKKRRAARRKKEKENININIYHSSTTNNLIQGNDDLKFQDKKESDGGEVNSLAYHEHGDHHDPFNDRSEVVGDRNPPAARPDASDAMSADKVSGNFKIEHDLGGKEDSVVMIERDLKFENSYDRENGKFENIETAKESCYESGNGGATLNGESLAEKNSKVEIYNLVKTVDSMSDLEKYDTGVASLLEAIDLVGKMNEDRVYPLTNENDTKSSLEEPKPKESNSEMLTSSHASISTKFTNALEHTKNSETPKCSKSQPSVSSVPNLVQKTSWWSCCGLLEVLSSSKR